MVNFKEKFNKYILDKGIEKPTQHDFEENYFAFIETYLPDISAKPVEFFENMLDDDLIALFDEDEVPFKLVLDEISYRDTIEDLLKERLGENGFKDQFIYEKLLRGDDSISYALDLLANTENEKLLVMAIDTLITEIDEVYDEVLEMFKAGDDKLKIRCVDVLAFGRYNDSVFSYIIDLFNNKKNIQLYAYYLGRYGSEKALPFLTNMLNDSSLKKEEKSEIENSIEILR